MALSPKQITDPGLVLPEDLASCCQNPEPLPVISADFFLSSFILHPSILASSSQSTAPTEEVLQLARGIAEFQKDSGYSKETQVDSYTQRMIDHLLSSNDPVKPTPQPPPKRKAKVSQASSSPFYSDSWTVGTIPLRRSVAYFETLVADIILPVEDMDPNLQSLSSSVSELSSSMSDLTQKYDSMQLDFKEKLDNLQSIFASFMANNTPTAPNPTTSQQPDAQQPPSQQPPIQEPQAAMFAPRTERWNQADLGYFDPHLDRSHGEGEIVSLGKEVYFRTWCCLCNDSRI